uniref:Uncharacterized protein n=1 Tax=Arundo donax TaxID=35708 RepID=A0A0A9GXD2_ARUDO
MWSILDLFSEHWSSWVFRVES